MVPAGPQLSRTTRTATGTSGPTSRPPTARRASRSPTRRPASGSTTSEAGQYYLHRFYKYQPDLNVANPAVRDEIARIIGFWMQLGLSGFRVDAVPFLLETSGQADAARPARPARLPAPTCAPSSAGATARRVLLGEVNLPYADTLQFFGDGDGDELTMCFDFIGMQQHVPVAGPRRRRPARRGAAATGPQPPKDAHWATFVRNHDELTLDKLSEAERQEVFDAFGPDKDMQLYGRGLRRRLPPMLDGDQRRIRMVYSLLFSLPGTPVLFYGEEIGMGENLEAEGRLAVRTPMQWTAEPGGGFSTADPSTFPEPLAEGAFGPEHVNVRDQSRDPDSLLSFFRHLVELLPRVPRAGLGHGRRCSTRARTPGRCSRTAPTSTASPSSRCTTSRDRKVTATLPLTGLGGPRPVRRAGRRRVDGDGRRRRARSR